MPFAAPYHTLSPLTSSDGAEQSEPLSSPELSEPPELFSASELPVSEEDEPLSEAGAEEDVSEASGASCALPFEPKFSSIRSGRNTDIVSKDVNVQPIRASGRVSESG